MQRIERYGVIALVFLLVTVAAVSFWGEGRDTEPTPGEESVALTAPPAGQTPGRPREGRQENAHESNAPVPFNRGGTQNRGGTRNRRGGQVPPARAEIVEIEQAPPAAEPEQPSPRGGQESAAEQSSLYESWPPSTPGRDTRGAPGTGRSVDPLPGTPASTPPNQPQRNPSSPTIRPQNQPPASTGAAYVWHDVLPNETLSEIAEARLGKASRWREIQVLNAGLTPESLRSGTRIKIPSDAAGRSASVAAGGAPPSTPSSREPRSEAGRVYVVKNGDTLSRIASRELGDVGRMREIVAMNPGLDPDVVVLGARLNLPGGASAGRSIAQVTPPPASEPRRASNPGPQVR